MIQIVSVYIQKTVSLTVLLDMYLLDINLFNFYIK